MPGLVYGQYIMNAIRLSIPGVIKLFPFGPQRREENQRREKSKFQFLTTERTSLQQLIVCGLFNSLSEDH